jgi:signal transduction histidine kinase
LHIRRENDSPFPAAREARDDAQDYAQRVNRPLTTALGWELPDWLLDFGPVFVVVLWGLGAIAFSARHGAAAATAGLLVALVVLAAALVLRHRWPIGVLAVVLATSLLAGNVRMVELPILLAVFTVAEYKARRQVVAGAIVAAAVAVAVPLRSGEAISAGAVFSGLVAVGLAVAVGLYLRARADYITGLRERAARLEREQQLLAGQAVADERVRIARELHDVVAHNVSLMVVQSQALAATGGEDPERHAALGRVADLGREALSEMHRMLGVLRVDGAGSPEREPQPGVRDLEHLIARTRETGLDASLVVQGQPRELPPGVDLSTYRIVQEALTNVIRHAHAEHATVTLAYSPGALEVTVTDDGVGPKNGSATSSSGRHGLVGMRERVALFDGQLTAGPREDGSGYRLRAVLPVR